MREPRRPSPVRWHLVIPIKQTSLAKSRLAGSSAARTRLARAFAADALTAAVAVVGAGGVTVVSSDADVVGMAQRIRIPVVADPGAGLNAAVAAGFSVSAPGAPRPTGWAVLLGDLPALRPEDLISALAACAEHPRAVVPDAEGSGTVLLTSRVSPPEPSFGPGSAARHGQGAIRLELPLPRLRRDVDTRADLEAAVSLGVGRHTQQALAVEL